MLELNEAIWDCHFRTNCRVTRHRISTRTLKHGRAAEIKLKTAIPTHHPKTQLAKANQGPKLYSKVLAIEPNRLHKNSDTPPLEPDSTVDPLKLNLPQRFVRN